MRVINAEERQLVVTDEQLRSVRDVGDELQRALYLNVSVGVDQRLAADFQGQKSDGHLQQFNGLETLEGIGQVHGTALAR